MRRLGATATLVGWAAVATAVAACGGSSPSPSPATSPSSKTRTQTRAAAPARQAPRASSRLIVTRRAALPAARSGGAAAAFGAKIAFSGGLSGAGTSTDTVFILSRDGRSVTAGPLPGPAHDAAEVQLGGQLLLFGGGRSEGSDRIVHVLPGPAKVIGHLPQALSDLDATVIANRAYIIGGWNGTTTNPSIYSFGISASGNAALRTVAHLPLGVRYPAAAALGAQVIIAGGEMTSGSPTAAAWSFDPATGSVTRIPPLPAPIDHAAGAVLNGRFYLLGGLRRGVFSSTILSWAPGERRWRSSGHMPSAVSDATAVSVPGAIAVLGGRGAGGTVADITWLAARP